MATALMLILCLLVVGVCMKEELEFPEGFKFGAATSAYQIEGAWNVSDRTPSIWDNFVHERPESIIDRSNGDVACDSYNLWKEDIKIASELGLQFYRFSISWNRILPTGFSNKISKDGVSYYRNLIDGLLKQGIEPLATMYHFDLPQALQDLGGWTNPLIAQWFGDYANVLFALFGDKVKTWVTINESLFLCNFGLASGTQPPCLKSSDIGYYKCTKNVMLAHAMAYRIYEKNYKTKFQGRIGISNQHISMMPAAKEYEELAALTAEFFNGLYSYPIYGKDGNWPENVTRIIAENSKNLGYRRSKLPSFTEEEKEFVKGSADFYGLNYYTSRFVRKTFEGEKPNNAGFLEIVDLDVVLEMPAKKGNANSDWLYVYPEGVRRELLWLKKNFGDVEIIITENGFSTAGHDFKDEGRIDYLKKHLEQILLAIHEDKVNVTGYTVWSLMDNFEWLSGYMSKFGMYEVNFEDPMRKRTARASAYYYANVIKNRSLKTSK